MKQTLLIVLLVFVTGIGYNQTKKELRQQKRKALFIKTDSLISTQHYCFKASQAIPTGMQPVDLATHIAKLDILIDSVNSYLPFFGRAYEPTYNSEGGIKFETLLIDYVVEKDTLKNSFNISFKTKTKEDNYQCNLSVSYSGSATLSVTSNKRAHISFYGMLIPIKEK